MHYMANNLALTLTISLRINLAADRISFLLATRKSILAAVMHQEHLNGRRLYLTLVRIKWVAPRDA